MQTVQAVLLALSTGAALWAVLATARDRRAARHSERFTNFENRQHEIEKRLELVSGRILEVADAAQATLDAAATRGSAIGVRPTLVLAQRRLQAALASLRSRLPPLEKCDHLVGVNATEVMESADAALEEVSQAMIRLAFDGAPPYVRLGPGSPYTLPGGPDQPGHWEVDGARPT